MATTIHRSSSKRVLHNAFFLALLQLFNFLIPLLLLPYLTRTLDMEAFGAVMVALSSTLFAYVITDYGFSLSATYQISRHRNDHQAIESLLGRIFSAKILLVLVAIGGMLILSWLPAYQPFQAVFWAAIPAVVAQAYQPIWFFHGMERMKYYAGYMVLTKLAYLGLVLILVNKGQDAPLVLLSWSIAQSLGTFASARMMRQLGHRFTFGPLSGAVEELKSSARFFYSRLAVAAYTAAGSIIVGLSSLHQAALYTSSEQIYKAGQAVTNPVNQALHPHMARERNWGLFFRILPAMGTLLALGALAVFHFRETLISLVFGPEYLDAAPVLSLFLLTLIVNYLGASFGYPACAALARPDIANRSVLYGTAVFFVAIGCFWLAGKVLAIHVAISVLLAETLVAGIRITQVLKGLKIRNSSSDTANIS